MHVHVPEVCPVEPEGVQVVSDSVPTPLLAAARVRGVTVKEKIICIHSASAVFVFPAPHPLVDAQPALKCKGM